MVIYIFFEFFFFLLPLVPLLLGVLLQGFELVLEVFDLLLAFGVHFLAVGQVVLHVLDEHLVAQFVVALVAHFVLLLVQFGEPAHIVAAVLASANSTVLAEDLLFHKRKGCVAEHAVLFVSLADDVDVEEVGEVLVTLFLFDVDVLALDAIQDGFVPSVL